MVHAASPESRVVSLLLTRALGGPMGLLGFDGQGRQVRAEQPPSPGGQLPPDFELSPESFTALASGRRTDLEAGGARFVASGALDDAGVLWVALRAADDLHGLPRFTSQLVHQLRNALASVKLTAQALVRAGGLGPREKRRTEISLHEIGRLERLLATAAEFALGPERVPGASNPVELLQAAVAAVGPELTARQLVPSVTVAGDVPLLSVDRQRLQLCFENLLSWAGRTLAEGSTLEIALGLDAGSVRLELRDPGSEPQAAPVRAEARLDLALAAEVARELGGELCALDAAPRVWLKLWLGPRREGGMHGHAAPG